MKIKKIKSQGEYCYPATIAAAVKDANFQKEDGTVMTLGEINLELDGPKILLDVVLTTPGSSALTVDGVQYKNLSLGKVYTFKDFKEFRNQDAQYSKFDITYGRRVTSVPITGLYIAWSCDTTHYSRSFINQVDVSKLDTRAVTNMTGMFSGCRFVLHLDLSTFNTSNVTIMKRMFNCCESLKDFYIPHFDTSKVQDMSFMFCKCTSLTVTPYILNWNVSNVTNILYMFSYCESLVEAYLPNFNWSNLACAALFENCTSLVEASIGDTTGATTPNGVWASGMFAGCKSLKTIAGLNKFEVFNMWNTTHMFDGCSSLKTLDLSKFDTTMCYYNTHVTPSSYMDSMFKGCTSLGDITFGEGWGKGTYLEILDLCDCNSSGNYVLSANTWNSMLTMYDRKSAGGNLFIIRLNSKHIPNSGSNVPENWKENMAARGYTISEVEA